MRRTAKSMTTEQRMTFASQRDPSKTMYATPFVLKQDTSNRYKVDPVVAQAVTMHNSIPFLRDSRDTSNRSFKKLIPSSAFDFGKTKGYQAIMLGRRSVKEAKR